MMASAKKQEHLEAGKRRLEEFRKKKAADRAKKSANHLQIANVDEHNNQPVDNQHETHTDSNGAVATDGASEAVLEPSKVVIQYENRITDLHQNIEVFSNDTHPDPSYYSTFSTEIAQAPIENKSIDRHDTSWSSRIGKTNFPSSSYEENDGYIAEVSGRHDHGFLSDKSVAYSPQVTQVSDRNSNQASHGRSNEADLKEIDSQLKDFKFTSAATVSPENSGGIQPWNNTSYGSLHEAITNEDFVYSSAKNGASLPQVAQDIQNSMEPSNTSTSSIGERKLSDYFRNLSSAKSTTSWAPESGSDTLATGLSSSNYSPFYQAAAETNVRRSRPSFLDSINLQRTESGRVDFSSKVHDVDGPSSTYTKPFTENERIQPYSESAAPYATSAIEPSFISSGPFGNGNESIGIYRGTTRNSSMEREMFFSSRKQDDDFAALEQHIEDLTQEKFSLQRALDASRTLADSLAAENSSLTDSYNQQGSIVNQLKSDMEMLQEEIKIHLVELESVKLEYANVQLECTAADERAKLLASEVISLEEKALRLRSSELKLERQLENSQAEMSSFKRKLLSLEKDREDLQSTIDALREEKKLLQAKLRKGSADGKFVDPDKSLNNRKDVSTSTRDLFHEDAAASSSNQETDGVAQTPRTNASDSFLLLEDGQFNFESLTSSIPSDQLRLIQNINTLISELALEKEELTQALLVESSESSKLKEFNKELSRKLEIQTQRLELLTAQNIASENIPSRQPDPRSIPYNTPYADEGDEVVERVLGWIMKLFPGGPSRRRPSKLI